MRGAEASLETVVTTLRSYIAYCVMNCLTSDVYRTLIVQSAGLPSYKEFN
jgi:hypothetical protein